MSARVLSMSSSTGPSPLDLRAVSASLAQVDASAARSSRFSAPASASRPRVTPSPTALSRVRRCLFGARTAEEAFAAESFAKHELQKIEEQDRTRWNFDFAIEQPLEGAYAWTAIVTVQPAHPAIRGLANHDLADVDCQMPLLASPSSASSSQSSSTSTSPNVSRRNSLTPGNSNRTSKSKQLSIKDFMRIRKRPSTDEIMPENASKRLCES